MNQHAFVFSLGKSLDDQYSAFICECKYRLPQSLANGENNSDAFRLLPSMALLA
jgi:hypothetical protein